jgi:N-acetylmuramoyl-L-alanine amidase
MNLKKSSRKINKIILHCSATREGQDISVDTIRKWHVDGRGWSDIGYHYIVSIDGQIEEGRPIDRSGAHTKGLNSNSIGCCYIGGVESDGKTPKDTRNAEQLIAIANLLDALMEMYPDATLHGHNEFSNKACPSFDVQKEYDFLINAKNV